MAVCGRTIGGSRRFTADRIPVWAPGVPLPWPDARHQFGALVPRRLAVAIREDAKHLLDGDAKTLDGAPSEVAADALTRRARRVTAWRRHRARHHYAVFG